MTQAMSQPLSQPLTLPLTQPLTQPLDQVDVEDTMSKAAADGNTMKTEKNQTKADVEDMMKAEAEK